MAEDAISNTEDIDYEKLRERIEAAHRMVVALCKREREWMLSIPANPQRDPDIIIGDGLRAGRHALARAETLQRERDEAVTKIKLLECELKIAWDNDVEYNQVCIERDEAIAALRKTISFCSCRGTGKCEVGCTLCGDSTYDHYCNDHKVPCENTACIHARKVLKMEM